MKALIVSVSWYFQGFNKDLTNKRTPCMIIWTKTGHQILTSWFYPFTRLNIQLILTCKESLNLDFPLPDGPCIGFHSLSSCIVSICKCWSLMWALVWMFNASNVITLVRFIIYLFIFSNFIIYSFFNVVNLNFFMRGKSYC